MLKTPSGAKKFDIGRYKSNVLEQRLRRGTE